MNIDGYELNGGGACPEQYDVFKDGKEVGYLRLRHGYFRADYPTICTRGGKTIYEAWPRGDGEFFPDERKYYLTEAIRAIDAKRSPEREIEVKKYRHRKDGYTIKARLRKDSYNDCYEVYGYHSCRCLPDVSQSVNIAARDFIELFELIPEHCCDAFDRMIDEGIFYQMPQFGSTWFIGHGFHDMALAQRADRLTKLGAIIRVCPFCGRKLKDGD